MAQLISIAGGKILALNDDVVITEEMRENFKKIDVKDIPKELVDIPNSLMLLDEIPFSSIVYNNGVFRNDLNQKLENPIPTDTHVFVSPQYEIKDEQIPLLVKDAGIQLVRHTDTVFVEWSDEKNQLIFKDKNGKIVTDRKEADVSALDVLTIHDTIYGFSKKDYETIQNIEKEVAEKSLYVVLNMSEKEQMLYFTYKSVKEEDFKKHNKIIHELKHFKSKILMHSRLISNDGGELSAEDYYKLKVEDEKTAFLAVVIDAVNTYIEKGDLNDTSMFDDNRWIKARLGNIPLSEREDFVSNMDFIVNTTIDYWEKEHRSSYEDQFEHWVGGFYPQYYPLSKTVENKEEYELQRSMMYNFSVYNPKTGNYVNMDLSKKVRNEVKIPEYVQTNIINPAKEDIEDRKTIRETKISMGRLDESLIKKARDLHNEEFEKTRYSSSLKNLTNNGLTPFSSWDYKDNAGFKIVDEKEEEFSPSIKVEKPKQSSDNLYSGSFTLDDDIVTPERRLAEIRRKVAKKFGVEDLKLPKPIKKIEKRISEKIFGKKFDNYL